MKNTLEGGINPETQEVESVVTLHLFRHAEADRNPETINQKFELSEVGRGQALEKSEEIDDVNLDQSVAFGSPRWRSMQTSGFVMAGKSKEDIIGNESFEELKDKLPFKIASDSRLDFHLDKNTPAGKEMYKAVFEDHNLMRFMVDRSDKLASEYNDPKASTYSRHASDIASIVLKYTKVGNKWNDLVESGKYQDPNCARFLGTHGGAGESFLLKIIEKTKGVEEREKLLSLMPHQFDYTEGFDIRIINKGAEQKIHILFKKEDKNNPENIFVFEEDVPIEIINEIINEREGVPTSK